MPPFYRRALPPCRSREGSRPRSVTRGEPHATDARDKLRQVDDLFQLTIGPCSPGAVHAVGRELTVQRRCDTESCKDPRAPPKVPADHSSVRIDEPAASRAQERKRYKPPSQRGYGHVSQSTPRGPRADSRLPSLE